MINFPILVAFSTSFLITYFELITSKYWHTFFIVKKCRSLYWYSFWYGVFSAILMKLIINQSISIEIKTLANIWSQAIGIGILTKSLLHVRLFTASSGTKSYSIGLDSLVGIIETPLLENIRLYEFNGLRKYIEQIASLQKSKEEIIKKIKENIPNYFDQKERDVFMLDLEKTNTKIESMEIYIRQFGKTSFDRLFKSEQSA